MPELIDRLLANLEVGVGAFTSCDIRLGYKLTFEACATATVHYCLDGRGELRLKNGCITKMRPHSFVLLPPGLIYSIGANAGKSEEGERCGASVRPCLKKVCPPSKRVLADRAS